MLGRDDAASDCRPMGRGPGILGVLPDLVLFRQGGSAGESGSSISSAFDWTTDRRALTICPEPPETHFQETESHKLSGAD